MRGEKRNTIETGIETESVRDPEADCRLFSHSDTRPDCHY